MKTICVALIVKNESRVIARCLKSLKPYIDHWVICDTGSTDDTKDIIRQSLSGVPGELHDTPWVNFGHNRTELMGLAKGKADYILLIDADMKLEVHDEQFKEGLSADSYLVGYTGELDYKQKMLVKGSLDWEYVGATHEYIRSEQDLGMSVASSISLTHFCDGSRRPEKFTDDIKLLEEGLLTEPENTRYMFYLAQSLYDTERYSEAVHWYEKRADAGGWDEEVYFSLFKRAQSIVNLTQSFPLDDFVMAYDYRPKRMEALHEVIKHYRKKEMYHFIYPIVKKAVESPYPREDVLFIDKSIHDYKLMDELSICAYWVGNYQESLDLCEDILSNNELPDRDKLRVEKNKEFAKSKLI